MAKKDNEAKFRLDMDISLEGMTDVPEDKTIADIYFGFVFGLLFPLWFKGKGGGSYQESKDLHYIKETFLEAVKAKEKTVVLDRASLKFLNKAKSEVTGIPPEALEMMRRVGERIENAFNNELT